MNKLLFFFLAIIVVSGLIFTGCAGETATPTTKAPAPTSAAPAPAFTSAAPAPAPTSVAPAPAPTSAAPAPAPTSAAPAPAPTTQAPAPAAGQPQYGGKLVLITNQPITKVGAPADGIMFGARNTVPVFEQLLFLDEKRNVVGGPLAPSYDVSPDGKTITLHLRQGVQFSDGTPFNADAVKTNFQMDVANNVMGSAPLKNVASFDVIDDYTLRLTLNKFDCTLLTGMAGPQIGQIASPTALKKPTTPENLAKDHTVGTGPFLFDGFERDSYVRYKKNPNYWQKGKPYLDAVEIRTNPDLTVTIMAFRAGDAQWIENIDPVDATSLKKDGYFTDIARGLSFIHGLVPDGSHPNSPLLDKRVREAIEYAIDKETMMAGVGMGYYRVPDQMAMPEYPGYNPDLPPRKYDVAKAKKLLADAGYPNGLTLPLVTDVSGRKDILTAMQQYLKEAGINTTLDMADLSRIVAIKTKTGWEGILMDGGPSIAANIDSWRSFGAPYNTINMIKPADWVQRYDDLVSTPDVNARNQKWKGLVTQIYNDVSIIPYECDSPLYALNNNVHDLGWSKNGVGNWFDCVNVWLSK
jgi:peptide/nickel transport system substrate-binding protein